MAGQTINDRLLAARHSLAGQGLAKSVCKATTEEMIAPKKKHLDYLVHCTNEPNVSIPHLANLLIERSQNANWVVVYKALITVHHLLAYGNERFMQYLASSNSTFNLSNFLDKGGVQGAVGSRIGYDMSPFIRRYAKYLNEKALAYRTVAFDFCKIKRGKEEGSLRTMNADKLLKTLPILQAQLDGLLEFDCSANDLTNGVINMCFMLLFRDLIRLFACYNDGIINLLEKYFDMNKKQCKDALDLYKKFLVRMDRVGEFLKVAESVGIDKGDIPDLTKAPSSLLDALEQHLATLEGKRGSAANTPTQSASNQKNVKSGVSALSSTSSSFGTAAASARYDINTSSIDENIKAQALAEEEAAMNQYKSKVISPNDENSTVTNPFLSTPPTPDANIPVVDLFGPPSTEPTTDDKSHNMNSKASDDLLQLGNPFADIFDTDTGAAQIPSTTAKDSTKDMWIGNGHNGTANITGVETTSSFIPDSNFSTIFGNKDAAGATEQQQSHNQQTVEQAHYGKILTGDLDSSLASLVDNLNINKTAVGKNVQWNSPKNTAKPGANWSPQPIAATTGAGYKPMGQGMTISCTPSTLNHQFVHASFPVIHGYLKQGKPQAHPMFGAQMTTGMPVMNQTVPTGVQPQVSGMMGSNIVPGQGLMTQPLNNPQPDNIENGSKNIQLDPFGAL